MARAGACGIGRLNINTELRSALFAALEEGWPRDASDGLNMLALLAGWTGTAAAFTTAAHDLLSCTLSPTAN